MNSKLLRNEAVTKLQKETDATKKGKHNQQQIEVP